MKPHEKSVYNLLLCGLTTAQIDAVCGYRRGFSNQTAVAMGIKNMANENRKRYDRTAYTIAADAIKQAKQAAKKQTLFNAGVLVESEQCRMR
jgi:hypothetical protein